MRADADEMSQLDDGIARLEEEIDEVEGKIRLVQSDIDELKAELEKEGSRIVAISKDPAVVQLRDEKNTLRDKKNKLRDEKKLLLEKEARLQGGAGATAVSAQPARRTCPPNPLLLLVCCSMHRLTTPFPPSPPPHVRCALAARLDRRARVRRRACPVRSANSATVGSRPLPSAPTRSCLRSAPLPSLSPAVRLRPARSLCSP